MPRLSPFLSIALCIVSPTGNACSLLLPKLVSQLRDASGTFLLSTIVLAVVSEGMFALRLTLPETDKEG